jgi:hypothetical protein
VALHAPYSVLTKDLKGGVLMCLFSMRVLGERATT